VLYSVVFATLVGCELWQSCPRLQCNFEIRVHLLGTFLLRVEVIHVILRYAFTCEALLCFIVSGSKTFFVVNIFFELEQKCMWVWFNVGVD